MKTVGRVADVRAIQRPRPGNPLQIWAAQGALVAAVAVIGLVFFLSVFPVKRYTVPIGWDSSEYLWRTSLAQKVGVVNIDRSLLAVPSPKSGRPAVPALVSILSSAGRLSTFRVMMVLSSVMAVTIGLACAAFLGSMLVARPPWELAAVALGVAFSPTVIRLMMPEGYLDTMLAAAVLVAAAIPLGLSMGDRRALLPAVLLLGAGAMIHWTFFIVLAAAIGGAAVLLAPFSWTRWRRGEQTMLDTPSARLVEAVAGGAVLGGALIFGVLRDSLPHARIDRAELAKKIRRDLPKYRLPLTAPVAALGLVPIATPDRRREPDRTRAAFVLAFLLAWCGVIVVGYLARALLHLPTPLHRLLSFGLAIPLLAVLGVLWVARRAASLFRPLAVGIVILALAGTGLLAHGQWFSTRTWTDGDRITEAAAAGSYLQAVRVPVSRPVVFIISTGDPNYAGLWTHMIRAGLPADRIAEAFVYVGNPTDYLAHRPSDSAVSGRYFQRIRSLYARNPIAIVLAGGSPGAYRGWIASHPGTNVSSGVAVVQGPAPPPGLEATAGSPEPPVGPIRIWRLALIGAGALILLGAVGLGWTLLALRRWLRPMEVLAVAPAVGIAALISIGVLVDRLGLRLVGAAGAFTAVLAAAMGWGLLALSLRHSRGETMAAAETS